MCSNRYWSHSLIQASRRIWPLQQSPVHGGRAEATPPMRIGYLVEKEARIGS